jgi:hypothetical protein
MKQSIEVLAQRYKLPEYERAEEDGRWKAYLYMEWLVNYVKEREEDTFFVPCLAPDCLFHL